MLTITSLLGSIENLMIKNNTTTSSYDLSSGLKKRVQYFLKGASGLADTVPIPNNLYPAVIVEVISDKQELAQVGNSANRNHELEFNIVCLTMYGLGTETPAGEARENANLEAITLAQNIEAILKNNITISNTVDYSIIERVVYQEVNKESIYNCMGRITLQAKRLST